MLSLGLLAGNLGNSCGFRRTCRSKFCGPFYFVFVGTNHKEPLRELRQKVGFWMSETVFEHFTNSDNHEHRDFSMFDISNRLSQSAESSVCIRSFGSK